MAIARRIVFAICALALQSGSAHAEMRTWSDSTGQHQIEAEFVELKDGAVELRKADGNRTKIPLSKLSEADQAFVRSLTSTGAAAAPLEAVVRIVARVPAANGSTQDLQLVGCAIDAGEGSSPVVITSRMLLGEDSGYADAALAKAGVFELRPSRQLGSARKLGFPAPQGRVISGLHDFVIVLPLADGATVRTLPLAEADAQPGETVLIPLLPRPQADQARARSTAIRWTKWTVVRSDDSRIFIEPQDGQFPSTGAVPIVNDRYQLVGMFVSHVIVDGKPAGDGPSLSVVRAALAKAEQGATAGSTTSPTAAVAMPPFLPLASGPVDSTAEWRTSYEALAKTITTKKAADGSWQIDWGEAADLGAWYERERQTKSLVMAIVQGGGDRIRLNAMIKHLAPDLERAAKRLEGVTWSGVLKHSRPIPDAGTRFDLPPLPEPLRMSFWVDRDDAANWTQVEKGDRVRFTCNFTIMALGGGDLPQIDVLMTLIEG